MRYPSITLLGWISTCLCPIQVIGNAMPERIRHLIVLNRNLPPDTILTDVIAEFKRRGEVTSASVPDIVEYVYDIEAPNDVEVEAVSLYYDQYPGSSNFGSGSIDDTCEECTADEEPDVKRQFYEKTTTKLGEAEVPEGELPESFWGFSAFLTKSEAEQVKKHPNVVVVEEDGDEGAVSKADFIPDLEQGPDVQEEKAIPEWDRTKPLSEPRYSPIILQKNAPYHLNKLSEHTDVNPVTSHGTPVHSDGFLFQPSAGEGVDIYVMDSGIDTSHAEFGGRAIHGVTFAADKYGAQDIDGHGTHVAGLAGGRTCGAAKKATLISVRVLDFQGNAPFSVVIAGINWTIRQARRRNRPSVLNLSVSARFSTAFLHALNVANRSGIHIVGAAGNDFREDACTKSPSNFHRAISVGSSDEYNKMSYFSNVGKCVDIFAAGHKVNSAKPGGAYVRNSGTSMATAVISGAVATILGQVGFVDPETMKKFLLRESHKNVISAVPRGTPNRLAFLTPRKIWKKVRMSKANRKVYDPTAPYDMRELVRGEYAERKLLEAMAAARK